MNDKVSISPTDGHTITVQDITISENETAICKFSTDGTFSVVDIIKS